jgi:hypothetical protein
MTLRRVALAFVLMISPLPKGVHAQQGADPTPIVQASIDPQRVVVGQQAVLRLLVLAPNYLTSPPELPGFQVRNAVTRQLAATNTSERRDGMTYAGVRFEFAIFPQEAGSYALADQKVRVKYAAEPPTTREIEVTLPRVTFEAVIPNAATSLRPFVSADRLTVEQKIERSSDRLKTGDAVVRKVTIKAEGTPAMLLPPQMFDAVDGLRLYPAQPELEDKVERRSGVVTSSRIDAGTYMLEREGDYSLPAIDIGWWNVAEGKVEQVHLDAVAFKVGAVLGADATAAGGADVRQPRPTLLDMVVNHWLATAFALFVLVALAWVTPAAVRQTKTLIEKRRAAYRASEAWSFRQFRSAARQRKPEAAYFGLLVWLRRFEPVAPVGTIDALTCAANDPVLEQQINALQNELFASVPTARGWSPRILVRHVSSARRRLGGRSRRMADIAALPPLNPAASRAPLLGNRKVAR